MVAGFYRRLPFRIAESRCYFPKTSRMASIEKIPSEGRLIRMDEEVR